MKKQILNCIKTLLPKKADLPKLVLILLWAVVCFWFFQTKMKYHFFYTEQHHLFLLSGDYIGTYFDKPAWLACLVGDFLIQYYYYLIAGPLILTIVLLTLGDLLRRGLERQLCNDHTKRLGHRLMSWIAVIAALLFITYEARLCLDERYYLTSLIALCGGAAMWLVHDFMSRLAKKWWMRVLFIIPMAALAYWLFGRGMWQFLIIEAMSMMLLPALVTGVAAYFIIGAIAPSFYLDKDKALNYPGKGKWVDYEYAKIAEGNLAFDNQYYWGNYPKVIDMYEKLAKEKKTNPAIQITNEMTFFYSLSLAQMQILPEKLVTMENPYLGTFVTINSETPLYTIGIIHELYYLIGDMTYAERAALLANTFSPNGRNVRMIKRLAEANLVSGDYVAADKYLRLLKKTLVYKNWADSHTPGYFSVPVKMEIDKKQQFVNTTDNIRLGDSCYTILTQLLDSNPDNLIALSYLLCSDMLSKERDTFIYDYEKYDGGRIPLFQQIYNSAKQ